MATLTEDQFRALLATIIPQAAPQPPVQQPPRNDAAALGPMPPCILGSEKMTRLQHFETWLEEAENRMKFLGVTDDTQKVSLLRSWGGPELVTFMKSQGNIRFDTVPAEGTVAAIPADTYE